MVQEKVPGTSGISVGFRAYLSPAAPPSPYYLQGGSVTTLPTPHDDTQRELYSERRSRPPLLPAAPDPAVQRKRMLIALGVLLVALVAVVIKDWDFWFPPSEEVQERATPRKTA